MMNAIYKIMGLGVLIISIGIGWFWQSLNNFSSKPVQLESPSIDFEIKPGVPLTTIARKLKTANIISDDSLFLWLIKLEDKEKNIKAGEYVIKNGSTPKDILLLFVSGQVKQYPFTIVEGWSFKQLMVALSSNLQMAHTLKGKSNKEIMASIGHENEHPEGRFLPDTYKFPAGSSDVAFLKRAYNAMNKLLEKAWQNRADGLPLKNKYEALILASIVEKETGFAGERAQIAGVFTRRLQKRMRLQTDPTVIYGLGDEYDGNLKKKHLKQDGPYNTYRRFGLTPTPIAMPSEAAIHAALHPEAGDTLYFVAKGNGRHYFSSTIKEHNKAVRKFQIRQRKVNYRSTPEKQEK